MMLVCNDGWHGMMLFICSSSTYLVFMAKNIRDVFPLNILSAATQIHLWGVFKVAIQSLKLLEMSTEWVT